MERRYLHRLPIRASKVEPSGDARVIRPIGPAAIVAIVALLSISIAAARAVERVGASMENNVTPGWPADGCLKARMKSLRGQNVVGQASLCNDGAGIDVVISLDNLEPNSRYTVWITQAGTGSRCYSAQWFSVIQSSNRPCTFAGPGDETLPVMAHGVAQMKTDAHGTLHIREAVQAIKLPVQSQVQLVVAAPHWSPVPFSSYGVIEEDSGAPMAKAEFNVP